MSSSEISIAPYLPVWLLTTLALAAIVLIGVGLLRNARGWVWRTLFFAIALTMLLNPQIITAEREPLDDTVLMLVDHSASARIDGRDKLIENARLALHKKLDDIRGIRVEEVIVDDDRNEGSALFAALRARLAEIDRTRLGAIVALTDGIVHDVPDDPGKLDPGTPFHALIAGRPDETDRKLVIEKAPTFGLLEEPLAIVLRVDDYPQPSAAGIPVTLRKDGEVFEQILATPGESIAVPINLDKAGKSVIEAEAAPMDGDGELTLLNNRATVTINGIRDRLRVLLVSGQPYPGLRVWRNLLKADPAVDLVHFTILRPPEKQDGTPIRELALIAFPSRELFEVKLPEFDLVIFDRYARRGLLPLVYLDNVARYVEQGGALLDEAGPEFAEAMSLYRTPLSRVLPGRPSGEIFERGFKPAVTRDGTLHPVTAGLGDPENWGRWFRQIDIENDRGRTLMTGVADRPLLVLDRVGEGRVAQLLSDQAWLWARGFEGGGPQAPLLRRLVHWLMKEPELEEEALSARAEGDGLTIERRSLEITGDNRTVTMTAPSGKQSQVDLAIDENGIFTAYVPATEDGTYRIVDGDLVAYASPRRLSRVELTELRATGDELAPVVDATGGSTRWLDVDGIPEFRIVGDGRASAGRGWIGIRERNAHKVTGVTQKALLPPLLALILLVGTLCTAWWREGRN